MTTLRPTLKAAPVVAETDIYKDKTVLGFWLYLMTDLVLFATLFATYGVLHNNTNGGPAGATLFNLPAVLIETVLLLTSSFSCGMALLAAQRASHISAPHTGPAAQLATSAGRAAKRQLIVWLCITFVLGATFLGMELSEFSNLVTDGNSWRRSGFLSGFFTLVGTHGLHILSGLIWMALLIVRMIRGNLTARLHKQLTLFSLFWHMLDIVWIFIFSIVYLVGAA